MIAAGFRYEDLPFEILGLASIACSGYSIDLAAG